MFRAGIDDPGGIVGSADAKVAAKLRAAASADFHDAAPPVTDLEAALGIRPGLRLVEHLEHGGNVSGRTRHRLKFKNPSAPAGKREAEENGAGGYCQRHPSSWIKSVLISSVWRLFEAS